MDMKTDGKQMSVKLYNKEMKNASRISFLAGGAHFYKWQVFLIRFY